MYKSPHIACVFASWENGVLGCLAVWLILAPAGGANGTAPGRENARRRSLGVTIFPSKKSPKSELQSCSVRVWVWSWMMKHRFTMWNQVKTFVPSNVQIGASLQHLRQTIHVKIWFCHLRSWRRMLQQKSIWTMVICNWAWGLVLSRVDSTSYSPTSQLLPQSARMTTRINWHARISLWVAR